MFFMLRILLFTIYISEINNFILKKTSQVVNRDIKQTGKRIIFQDVQHISTVFPNLEILPIDRNITNKESLKLNTFDKRLADEVLIKRHIHENEVPSSMFKSTKSSFATPTLELKQKWPVVELLSESDEFKENSQYFDEVEKKPFPFFHDIENESKIIELPPKIVNNYNLHEKNNQSQEKTVGLRSLLGRVRDLTEHGSDDCVCEVSQRTIHRCPTPKECTRTTVSWSMMTIYMPYYDMFSIPKCIPTACPTAISPTTTTSIPRVMPPGPFRPPMGFPIGVPMGVPMGVPVGYPVGIPANFPMVFPGGGLETCPSGIPHSYYQLNAYKKGPKKKKSSTAKYREELYYDNDESIENTYIYNDDDDDIRNSIANKQKLDKKLKGDIIIDIAYDEKPSEQKLNCIPPVRDPPIQKTPENFVKDICKELKTSYGETIIKDWYCSSAYSMKSRNVFVLVTLIIFFTK